MSTPPQPAYTHSPAGADGPPFASRAGLKLDHALTEFGISPAGWTCADFGCNAGGFTDCLLRRRAARVYAIDTGYGALAWRLRNDPRVVVMERTNALHAAPPVDAKMNLVTIDLSWTPQRHCIPAALRWLSPGGRIISLIKPHYEAAGDEKKRLVRGVLDEQTAECILARVLSELPTLGVAVQAVVKSPIIGGAGKKSSRGNAEWLALLDMMAP